MNTVTDRSLIGTEWVKVDAKHAGQKARVESITPRGPKMRFIGKPQNSPHSNRDNQQFQRLDWRELGLNWQPNDKRSQEIYDRYCIASAAEVAIARPDSPYAGEIRDSIMKIVGDPLRVTVDKQDFVVDVQPDVVAKDVAIGELMLPCTGGWHKGAGKAYSLVPSSQFHRVERGSRKGEWMKTCDGCRAKASESQKRMATVRREAIDAFNTSMGELDVTTPATPTTNGVVIRETHQWRVTVVKETVVMVEATDFLDAATKAGEGEVTRVERIG